MIGPFNVELYNGPGASSQNHQKLRNDKNFVASRDLYPSIEHICPAGGIYLRVLRKDGGASNSEGKINPKIIIEIVLKNMHLQLIILIIIINQLY